MDRIDTSVIEAGKMDGASPMQEFLHIILPNILPAVSVFLVTGLACFFTNDNNVFNFLSWQAIHWNNGLWDTSTGLFDDGGKPFTDENEYVSNMLRVAKELKKIAPRVIFATTTPVRPDYEYNDNGVIARYNEVLVPQLRALGLEINDLHKTVSADIIKYVRESDKIHLSEEGAALCAKQVAAAIKQE